MLTPCSSLCSLSLLQTYIHVGSVDPLVDDSLRFAERLLFANPSNTVKVHILPKVSHAYMQVVSLLPEAREAVEKSIEWLKEILDSETYDMDASSNSQITTSNSSSSTYPSSTSTSTISAKL